MVDETLVLRKMAQLDEYLGQLREYSETSADAYRSSWKTQRIVERTLQMMLEVCADIANHIIADKSLPAPNSYSECFKILAEGGVLSGPISETMQEMVKFRNIIVHGYDKIDESIIVGILQRRLSDFSAYRDAVTRPWSCPAFLRSSISIWSSKRSWKAFRSKRLISMFT